MDGSLTHPRSSRPLPQRVDAGRGRREGWGGASGCPTSARFARRRDPAWRALWFSHHGIHCRGRLSLDTKGRLTQARLDAVALVTTDRSLAQARTDEQSDAHGSHDDELERVPACPQHDEVEPAWAAVGCRARADAGDQDVRKRDQRRGHPPLESATCADGSHQLPTHAAGGRCEGGHMRLCREVGRR